MSGSITYCSNCKATVWAGTIICPECGSPDIAPTLREVHAYYYNADPDFKKMVDDNRTLSKEVKE